MTLSSSPQTIPLSTPAQQVVELLKLEANAIHQAAEQLQPDQLEQALSLLASCRGKVVVTGVGKSGIVAQKIAATLTSIGTVAIFLHPCDAMHGDLGVVTVADVVVLLSNSGETEELAGIIPHLRRRQVPIVAIVGNLRSTLASRADVVLNAAVDREACPLNLAPTTSTTVALAIGDALAMTLMQLKGVTSADFAVNHPAGRLGKRLTLTVGDVMHTGVSNPILLTQATWIEIISEITRGGLGAVNITDEQGRLVGLITDGDLRRWVQKTKPVELESLTAVKIMTASPVVVRPETLAYEALQLMENRSSQISVLPVVDIHQSCIGLVRLHDILRSGL